MRREDRQRKPYEKRLAIFRCIYERKAREWAASYMSDLGNIEEEREYKSFHRVSDYILPLMPEEFRDLLEYMKPFRWPAHLWNFYERVLSPIDNELRELVEYWYEREWKKKYLNFKNIPPAPPFQVQKLSNRKYQMGQFDVEISGRGKVKTVSVYYLKNRLLWSFTEEAPLDQILHRILPSTKRVAAVCDWSQLEELPEAVQRAIARRCLMIKGFYEKGSDYEIARYRLKKGKVRR